MKLASKSAPKITLPIQFPIQSTTLASCTACLAFIAVLFLVFVLSAPSVFAASDPNSLSSFFNNTTSFLSGQGRDFVSAAHTAVWTPVMTFRSVYDSFGPGSCGDEWVSGLGGNSFIFGTWFVPAILAAITVVIGIGIVYMWGQFFNSPQLLALAKDELFQTGVTLVRIFLLVGMIAAANTWYTLRVVNTDDPVYNNPNNVYMIDAAMGFSRLMVSDMVTHYSMLVIYNMIVHTLYSSTMWFGVTWRAMYSFNLGPVLKPVIDILGSALHYLSLGISEWLLHIVTLCLIKKWTWTLFIPLSVLLRAFPYTRNAGEALFSLCFVLAFFYPFMFIFDYEVHKMMKYNLVDSEKALGNFMHRSGILSVFGSVLVMMFFMAGVFMPFFLGSALNLALELVRSAVYYIVIMGIFLPFINIFVTLTAAKEMASFFKVDVNFMAFLKII